MMPVPTWKAAGRLMYFPRLSRDQAAYTVGWRIRDEPDAWTRRFEGFKYGAVADATGGARVLREAVAELAELHESKPARTGLTMALSSQKTKFDPRSPLFSSGLQIAKELNLQWFPDAFTKQVHRSLHSINGACE